MGLTEMEATVEQTGGRSVQTESFSRTVFRDSCMRVLLPPGEDGPMNAGSSATFRVRVENTSVGANRMQGEGTANRYIENPYVLSRSGSGKQG